MRPFFSLPAAPGGAASRRAGVWLALLSGWVVCRPLVAEVTVDPGLPAEVAASVNGQNIPRQLVDQFLKNDREALTLDAKVEEQRRQIAELPASILDELVDRALIAQGVRERGIEPTAAEIDAAEHRMVLFCGNPARYAAYAAQSGFTTQSYRENVLRTTANGQAMIADLTRGLTVDDAAIKAYYDAHHADADFQQPERVAGRHILVIARPGLLTSRLAERDHLSPDSPEMAAALEKETARCRERAEAIRAAVTKPGADFAAVAGQESDDPGTRAAGGSLGIFAYGVHSAALDDAFFALKPGEVGPVVQTEFGFHVVRTDERFPAGEKNLADATGEIRYRLLRQKAAERLRSWLAEARAKAKIIVHDQHDLPENLP